VERHRTGVKKGNKARKCEFAKDTKDTFPENPRLAAKQKALKSG